jgi:hypothetical protein
MSKNVKNIFYKTLAMSNDIILGGLGVKKYFFNTPQGGKTLIRDRRGLGQTLYRDMGGRYG